MSGPSVRLLRSHHWTHDRLLEDARPPATFTWAESGERADMTIYIVPPWPEPSVRAGLRMVNLRDWERLYIFSQNDDGWFWAPGVFTGATERCAPEIAGGFYLHADHYTPGFAGSVIETTRDRTPELLWSFVGDVRTAPVLRGSLIDLGDPRSETRASVTPWDMRPSDRMRLQAEYADTLTRSLCVVCPKGFAASSYRLFEAMRAGRVPVVISDGWRPPPLVDWESCSIRVAEADVDAVPDILREREPEVAELGRRAREVWEERFSPQGMVHQLVESCIMLGDRRPRLRRRASLAVASVPTTGARRAISGIAKPQISAALRLGRQAEG